MGNIYLTHILQYNCQATDLQLAISMLKGPSAATRLSFTFPFPYKVLSRSFSVYLYISLSFSLWLSLSRSCFLNITLIFSFIKESFKNETFLALPEFFQQLHLKVGQGLIQPIPLQV